MASTAGRNPLTSATLSVFEASLDRKQAQLDYERAQARENAIARDAVPGLIAQLTEMEAKKQKQRESIAKASEQQQASPASMLPPLTEVSGQTSARGAGAGAAVLSELANQISGGRGIRQQGAVPGLPRGMPGGQPGIGQGINPNVPQPGLPRGMPAGGVFGGGASPTTPGPPVPAPVPSQAGGPLAAPATSTPASAPPTAGPFPQTVYTPAQEEWYRKLARAGLNVLGARVGTAGLGQTLLPDPGQVTTYVPSAAEVAQQSAQEAAFEAKPLSILLQEADLKQGTPEAGEVGQRIVDHVSDLTKRRGQEIAQQAVRLAGLEVRENQQAADAELQSTFGKQQVVLERQKLAQGMRTAESMRKEAVKESQPSEKLRDREATILNQKPEDRSAEDQRFLQEMLERRRTINPFQQMENEFFQGMGGAGVQPGPQRPITEDEFGTLNTDLTKRLGRKPTDEEIKAELKARGLSF